MNQYVVDLISADCGQPMIDNVTKGINIANGLLGKEPIKPAIVKRQLERSGDFCPNGHAIPEGRSKCLARSCKHAH